MRRLEHSFVVMPLGLGSQPFRNQPELVLRASAIGQLDGSADRPASKGTNDRNRLNISVREMLMVASLTRSRPLDTENTVIG